MELIRALAVLAEPPGAEARRLAEILELPPAPPPEEHTELFLRQLYPYASVYVGPEGMLGGEARDRVAGLWRALGETPPAEPDHLTTLLGLLARLGELEGRADEDRARAAWRRARAALVHEHLLSWLPAWLQRVRELAPPFYRAWAELLADALAEGAGDLDLPTGAPACFRAMPGLPEPGTEADRGAGARAGSRKRRVDGSRPSQGPGPATGAGGDFLSALLAAGRSGLVLARADLVRAARELGLGLRAGERRYILTALLSQDADPVLDWIREEAEIRGRQHGRGRCWRQVPETTVRHWRSRARETAAILQRASRGEVTHARD